MIANVFLRQWGICFMWSLPALSIYRIHSLERVRYTILTSGKYFITTSSAVKSFETLLIMGRKSLTSMHEILCLLKSAPLSGFIELMTHLVKNTLTMQA